VRVLVPRHFLEREVRGVPAGVPCSRDTITSLRRDRETRQRREHEHSEQTHWVLADERVRGRGEPGSTLRIAE
jgi:hypothetical protein